MLNNIAVIGAGTMGNGIAHLFAQFGFKVALVDLSKEKLAKSIITINKNFDRQVSKGILSPEDKEVALKNITTFTEINTGVGSAELVVEAATENTELKLSIFKMLDEAAPEGCILATNTSSISITRIAAITKRPSDVIGMHFMNPVPIMKLVEVINGYNTSPEVTSSILSICKKLQKIACEVNDYPGFIANRILMPMLNEAMYALYEGVAGLEEIDTIMKLGMSHPMGPLELADFIGLDTCHAIMKVLQEGLGNTKYAPCPLLSNMVMAGKLGVKSGEGFYVYTAEGKVLPQSHKGTKRHKGIS